jgi:hypothetical protein
MNRSLNGIDIAKLGHDSRVLTMEKSLQELHLKIGFIIGAEKTCGSKIDYKTEVSADRAAESMNSKPKTRNILEAYPCAFCNGWHIGRAMTRSELESYLESHEI